MLDFGLSKMAMIGVVALIVLGPERLPRVARTAGALLGRARRYVDELKSQVTHEMELEELRRMKAQFESTVGRFEDAIDSTRSGQHDALSTLARPDSPIAIAGGDTPAIGVSNGVTSGTIPKNAYGHSTRRRRPMRTGLRNRNRAPEAGS
jgi:sec-independent protein translocase protein TatB